ncbi:MAG: hypothetical protein ACR2JF_02195 [Iamia sp.]
MTTHRSSVAHHSPVPAWYALRGRRAPTALTHDRAWWHPPDRGPLRRRGTNLIHAILVRRSGGAGADQDQERIRLAPVEAARLDLGPQSFTTAAPGDQLTRDTTVTRRSSSASGSAGRPGAVI